MAAKRGNIKLNTKYVQYTEQLLVENKFKNTENFVLGFPIMNLTLSNKYAPCVL